jgi:predicted transcriptional regulator
VYDSAPFMTKLTEEEQNVLLALSELEPASLNRVAAKTGLDIRRLKAILETLAKKGLLRETEKDSANVENDHV